MKPLEAWSIISKCMTELTHLRQQLNPWRKAWSDEETTAQVIAFEALRRMEECGKHE